jgi:hypothetical protein
MWRAFLGGGAKADPMGREEVVAPGGAQAPTTPSLISDPHRETTTGPCLHEGGEMGNHPTINGGEAKVGRFSYCRSNRKAEFSRRRWE